MAHFTKRYHPPGTSPGTLLPPAGIPETPPRIVLIDYTDADFVEKEIVSADDCRPYLTRDTVTWIHVQGQVEADTLRRLGDIFMLHPLAMEDVINTGQRPKVDIYDEHAFIVMSHPVMHEQYAWVEQVSLFFGDGFVISFHPGPEDPFSLVRTRLQMHTGRIRSRGADYLLYALIDVVIDQGFPVLEGFGEQVEDLEEELLESPDKDTLRRLHRIKGELLLLRRMLWPQREVINALIREEGPDIDEDIKVYYRDCYDHTIQIIDLLETYRDMTTSMLDLYLSSVSNRLNEIMRVLTVIATIFIPLTFIVGVYGMNFGNDNKSPWAMPELRWYYGYPLVWLVMIVIAVVMLIIFKRRNWF
ncbi:MAG: magnesium/cobalt transporter CorA [Gammaproteobacteria bacterium]|jgi:magnesium transporter